MDMSLVHWSQNRGFSAKPKGAWGALTSYVGNSEGMLKSGSTALDVAQLWVEDDHLSAASGALRTAGGLCSVSKALVAWTGVAKGVSEGKCDGKFVVNGVRGISETASFLVDLEKIGGVALSKGALYAAKSAKGFFTVVADGFALHEEMCEKPTKLAERAQGMSQEMFEIERRENAYGAVRVIIGFAFHLFLAIGAIFLVPLDPVAITVFASIYIVALTVHHFVKSDVDDRRALNIVGRLNERMNLARREERFEEQD